MCARMRTHLLLTKTTKYYLKCNESGWNYVTAFLFRAVYLYFSDFLEVTYIILDKT